MENLKAAWEMFSRGYLFPRWSDKLNNGFGRPLWLIEPAIIVCLIILLIGWWKKNWLFIIWAIPMTAFCWLPLILEQQKLSAGIINENIAPNQLTVISDTQPIKQLYEHKSDYLWHGYELEVPEETEFRFSAYNYPGWEVWFDDKPILIKGDHQGLINFTLPAKDKTELLEIVFRQTKTQLISEYLSIVSVGLLFIFCGYGLFKKTA